MSNKKALQIATKQLNKAKAPSKPKDIIYDPRGQWKYPGQNTRIPSNRITMKGVPYPVYGQPNRGQAQMMYPGAEYMFPGADYVDEYPEMAVGGAAGCPPNCPPNANDSLAIYKNALEQKAYYDKLRQYFLPPMLDKNPLSLSKVKKDIKQLEKEHLQYTDQSFWTPEEKKKFNEIKKKIKSNKDPNISYIVDAITGALDPNAPALRYDSRISPQGMMNYNPIEQKFTSREQAIIDKINNDRKATLNIGVITFYDPSKADSVGGTKAQWLDYAKKHKIPEREMIGILYKQKMKNEASKKIKGFMTYIPYYDPIAVKPSKLLTDDEVRLRYKKYGRNGISESQLKRLGLLDDKKSDVVKDNKNVRPPVKDIKQITEPEPIKDDVVKTQDNVYKDVVLDKLPLKDITLDTPKGELIQGEPEEYYSPQYIQPGYKKTYPALYMKHHTSGQLIPHARPALTTQYKATPYSRVLQKVTGYDPRYMEGYTDEEGNYIPGEAEKAELEKRRIQFKGLSSPQDKAAQEEYNRAYDKYENEKAKQKFYSNIIKSGVFQNTRSKYQPGGETGCPEGYAFNPRTGECVEWNPTIWSSEEQPTSFDPVGDVIYMNPNDRPEGMSDEEYAQLYQDQLEHEQLHRLQWKNDELKGQNQTPLRMPSTVDNQEYPGDHYYNRRSEEVDYLHNYWKNHHPEEAEFIPDDVIYNSETDPAMYVLPWTVEGEARDYEYATHGGMESLFPKKQDGGPYNTDGPVAQEEYMEDYPVNSLPKIYGHEPEDYQNFLEYNQTAPENRRGYEEYKYGDPNSYDHYGMWDALGKPKDFNQALEMNPDWVPDEYDGYYHGFSVNPNTGVFLKSGKPGLKEGDTTWMEIKDHYLSPRSNENTPVFDIDLQRFRYIPKEEDGGIIVELTPEEIDEYAKGGYIIEDVSIPSLNTYAEGGESGCPPGSYWNGKACVKLPKGAKVITDPEEYEFRKAAYDDSLWLYNRHKAPIKPVLNRYIDGSYLKPIKSKFTVEHARVPGEESPINVDYYKKTGKWLPKNYSTKRDRRTDYFSAMKVRDENWGVTFPWQDYSHESTSQLRYKKPEQKVVFGKETPKETPKKTNKTPKTKEHHYPTSYDKPIIVPVTPGKKQVGETTTQTLDPKTGKVKTIIEPVYETMPPLEKMEIKKPKPIPTSKDKLVDSRPKTKTRPEVQAEYLQPGSIDTENAMEWVDKPERYIDWTGTSIGYRLPRFRQPGHSGPLIKKGKQRYLHLPSIETRNTARLEEESEYQYGGGINYQLGDEVDEATMKLLKQLGYKFEKI